MRRIRVINPNSNESVTEGLRRAVQEFQNQAQVDCLTLADGPFGIESDADILAVKPLILKVISESVGYDAFVIACYSDPALDDCRSAIRQPVFGIQRSALETATSLGNKFGVLALSEASIARHLVYIDKLGLSQRLAGELPLNISVDDAANDARSLSGIVEQGRRLVDEHGADVLILGCAGMTAHRAPAEQRLQVPVIDPAQAAVSQALYFF